MGIKGLISKAFGRKRSSRLKVRACEYCGRRFRKSRRSRRVYGTDFCSKSCLEAYKQIC